MLILGNKEMAEAQIGKNITDGHIKHNPPTVYQAEMTAYNAGDPYQCDMTPCISASGDNICTMLAQGQNICAANMLPLGTKIKIDGIGTCLILDRMASRFTNRIDWAYPADKHTQAVKFGLKTVNYTILR